MPLNTVPIVSERGTANLFTDQEALSTTAEEVVAARVTRRYVDIINTDNSITVYYGFDNTVGPTTGFPLAAGESVRIETKAAIWMEAASGTPTVAFAEAYD